MECDRGKAFRQTAADSAEAAEKKSLRIAEDFSLSRVQMLLMMDGESMKNISRCAMMLMICAVGLLEGHYLPRYGIEWMLGAIAGTVFLVGYWVRMRWD